ncbi:MAG: phosphoglycolate phosphatase [Thermoplasmata archaeon]
MRRAVRAPKGLRVLVTDVDGTLTDPQRRLRPAALGALRRLTDAGVPVVIATGNVLPIALAIHRSLGLVGPIVAENGGIVYQQTDTGERIERLADVRVALAAYRALVAGGLPVHRLFTDRWRETEVGIESNVPLTEVRRKIRGIPAYAESSGFAIHLMERGAGKYFGVRRALQLLGLRLEQAAAIGDGDNDARLLRAAGFGVSFPSASRLARSAANLVTKADGTAGLLQAIRASGLSGSRP